MKVVFLGSGAIGVPALHALAADPAISVVGAVTQPDRPAGRSGKPKPSPIKLACGKHAIPVLQPEKIRAPEAVEALRSWEAEVFVVAAYGQILPKAVLEMPTLGCLNIHASLLPKHRGASPVHAAILAGDRETGITIMWVGEGLDTGPILLQRPLPIAPDATAGSLHDELAELAPEALREALTLLASGNPPRQPQEHSLASYAPKLSKSDGCLEWRLSAEVLERRVRGLNPWPGAWTLLPGGSPIKIHRAGVVPAGAHPPPPGEVLPAPAGVLHVQTGSGVLRIDTVQPSGSKPMASAAFLRGHPLPPGSLLGR